MTWLRRARPHLGTLVEVGAPAGCEGAIEAAFQAVAQIERLMSKHLAASDVGRFNAARAGSHLRIHPWTFRVLALARDLAAASEGRFDITQGTGRWSLVEDGLLKMDAGAQIDLGGIAKGEAVDRGLEALLEAGASAGWVNAGGDLRVQGLELPVGLRDEREGGLRPWALISEGALATSRFPVDDPGRLCGQPAARHVTVAAPRCAPADALTKVIALTGMTAGTLLDQYEAQAWIHE
ncbi:FAD:protein FMN transferase [Geothrix sp. PMB-07]|uniref:FAD:protein FMN transferase n=1 Tax=Geothrix sp. PMB-07 TaxID=3068640 RepID=UPI002741EBDC|nr:FAD:protein FMN transferase [Geothrix sp. PMB-07]WLT30972.1 FAD:protein FMN transferase [Geothrix sp. PMB-07]